MGGEEVSMEEGCLSLPGIHETVKRPDRIHVTYLDEELKEHDEWVEGYLQGSCSMNLIIWTEKCSLIICLHYSKQMIKGKLGAMAEGQGRVAPIRSRL